ncbi:hypothetical protein [Cohnella candidum]|nr:hypothetical protein [Cohnella candidum]
MSENKLGPLFVIPPHPLTDFLLRDLIAYVKSISDPARSIEAAGVLPSQMESFERNGFEPTLARHGMIRPTDSFEIALSEEYVLKQPDPSDIEEIVSVLLTSFEQGTGDTFMNDGEEELKEDLAEFFTEMQGDDALRTASAVIWDQRLLPSPVFA